MSNIFGPGHHAGTNETASRPSATATGKPGDRWFAQCDSEGEGGTNIDEMWLNQIIANLRAAARQAGADEGQEESDDILAEAITLAAMGATYGVMTGGTTAYVVTNPGLYETPHALQTGLKIRTRVNATNTGASTLNAFGLGVKALRSPADAALSSGQLVSGKWIEATYDAAANGAAGAWLIESAYFTAEVLEKATASPFFQAAAPFGWTKSATHNDKGVRIVTDTSGGTAGGSVDFSTLFARTAVDDHTLILDEIPAHDHVVDHSAPVSGAGPDGFGGSLSRYASATDGATGSAGGGDPHSHAIDCRLKYVNMHIATRG